MEIAPGAGAAHASVSAEMTGNPSAGVSGMSKEKAMRDGGSAAVAIGTERETEAPVVSGKNYIYAIVEGGELLIYEALGLEGKDVYTITEGRLAAVVSGLSSAKIRPERANLRAHQAVLKQLMAVTTPLPMAFGTVAANPEAIHKILIRSHSAF